MIDESSRIAATRRLTFIVVAAVLFVGHVLLRDSDYFGNANRHTLMEAVAMLLALIVGLIAMVRFYSKKTNLFLFVGTGFIGTALLDGYHAVVTSPTFKPYLPGDNISLIPWSWLASRVFLAVFMWIAVLSLPRQTDSDDESEHIGEKTIYLMAGLFTLGCFVFFAFMPLGKAYFHQEFFDQTDRYRPQELIPGIFFLLALIGFWRRGEWQRDEFQYWLVMSLIVGVMSQIVYMALSGKLMTDTPPITFDIMFDAAHVLKAVSYACVLVGLLVSMFHLFRRAEETTARIRDANEELTSINRTLEVEVSERKRAEQSLSMAAADLNTTVATEREARAQVENLLQRIRDAVRLLSSSSKEILASTGEQALAAQEQAAAVSETTAAVNEVAQTAASSSERARTVAESARRTDETARAGRQAVEDSIAAMAEVMTQVESITENILSLAEQSHAIGEIITTVSEIAGRSNMLSLNAAVEASRAGEHGKGFAVVAAEVKSLAEQSKKATGQVKKILGEIKTATESAVMATEQGTGLAGAASGVVTEAGKTITLLAETIADSARMATQISTSSDQQSAGLAQLTDAIRNIDGVTQQSLAAVRQIEMEARKLTELSDALSELTAT